MKKSLFAFAAVAAILAGCAKEVDTNTTETINSVETPVVVLRASVPEDGTKVSTDNIGAFKWQAGDKVTVLNTEGTRYEFSTQEGGTAVDFGSASFEGALGTEAFYPASSSHASGKFYLAPSFTWVQDASYMPMLGTVDTEKLTASFKAVGGVLKLICYNVDDDARKLVVTSDTKKINGLFTPSGTPSAIATDDKGDGDNTITITFGDGHPANMVFYIPLPTGTLGKLTFTLKDGTDKKVFEQETKAAVPINRNQLLVAPALNCSIASDALLTNTELTAKHNADSWTSYDDGSITNTYGTWSFNAAYQGNYGSSGNYYMQLRNNSTVSYLKLPVFTSNILSVILHGVCNASEAKYTGKIFFRSTADNDADPIATAPTASSARQDLTMSIPNGYTTGYIMVDNPCRISAFTVKFRGETYEAPTISPEDNSLVIAVAAGDQNTASTTFTYTYPIDGMGIQAVSDQDWVTPTITGSGPYTLTVTADKKTDAGDREQAIITLRASGVSKTITVDQPTALVSNPSVSVTPGNGTFTAMWTKAEFATSYAVYLGDPSDEANNITTEVSFNAGTDTYTLTKDVDNGDYDLYVGISGVASNYIPESGFTHKSFTCSSSSYAITINQPASGGTITAKGQSSSAVAEQNEVIALVATPADGYKLSSWSVTKVGGGEVTVTSNSFVMPAEPVIVTATFAAKEWNLVTSVSSLKAGDVIAFGAYAITHKISGTTYTKYMVAGAYNSDKYDGVNATFNGDGTKITTFPATGKQFVLGGNSSDGWTFKDGTKYLNVGASSGKAAQSDDPITWSITITDGIARIQRTVSSSTYTWYFNPTDVSAGRFCPYTSTQKDMRIYRYE